MIPTFKVILVNDTFNYSKDIKDNIEHGNTNY